MNPNTVTDVESLVSENEQPIAIWDMEGYIRYVTDAYADLLRYEVEELEGKRGREIVAEHTVDVGREWQRVVNGEKEMLAMEITLGDGSVALVRGDTEFCTLDGEQFVKVRAEMVEDQDESPPTDDEESAELEIEPIDEVDTEINSTNFEKIDEDELQEITKNIRIESPGGEIPLNEIMLDLAATHNELEQCKQGGYTLYKALYDRLQEERKHNPDSDACTIIKEAMDAALGIYLRVERGDAEVNGRRDGPYSGYFNE